jgi:hypothetical protein
MPVSHAADGQVVPPAHVPLPEHVVTQPHAEPQAIVPQEFCPVHVALHCPTPQVTEKQVPSASQDRSHVAVAACAHVTLGQLFCCRQSRLQYSAEQLMF